MAKDYNIEFYYNPLTMDKNDVNKTFTELSVYIFKCIGDTGYIFVIPVIENITEKEVKFLRIYHIFANLEQMGLVAVMETISHLKPRKLITANKKEMVEYDLSKLLTEGVSYKHNLLIDYLGGMDGLLDMLLGRETKFVIHF